MKIVKVLSVKSIQNKLLVLNQQKQSEMKIIMMTGKLTGTRFQQYCYLLYIKLFKFSYHQIMLQPKLKILQTLPKQNHPFISVKIYQNRKYDSKFNFFLVKPINDICHEISSHETILMKQYEQFDRQNQFLKRYYESDQFPQRIKLLTNLYEHEKTLKTQNPRLDLIETKKYLEKRKRKLKKMQKKLKQIQLQQHREFQSQFLNQSATFQNKFSDLQEQERSFISSEYSIYNIFDDYNDDNQETKQVERANILKLTTMKKDQQEEDSLKHLIFDFDDIDKTQILKNYNKLKSKQLKKNLKNPSLKILTNPKTREQGSKIINQKKPQIKYPANINISKLQKLQRQYQTLKNLQLYNNGFSTYRPINESNIVSDRPSNPSKNYYSKNKFNISKPEQFHDNFLKITQRLDIRSYEDLRYFRNRQGYLKTNRQYYENPIKNDRKDFFDKKQFRYSPNTYRQLMKNSNQTKQHKSPEPNKLREKALMLINHQKLDHTPENGLLSIDENNKMKRFKYYK